MANTQILATYELFFQKILYKDKYNPTDADLTAWFTAMGELNTDGKADKVESATAGNFAGLDADGNLTDSGKNSDSFALLAHTHDTRYLRKDASNTFDSSLYDFEFMVTNGVPFTIDNTSGDLLPVVTHLNADKLDDFDAEDFALVNHTHSKYALLASAQSITGLWDFVPATGTVPFTVNSAMSSVVTNLNADKLDGNHAAAFALAAHTHGDVYYTEDEIDAFLALKLDKPNTSAADGEILVFNDATDVVERTGVDLSDLALASSLAAKADKVGSATEGNFAGLDGDGNLTDSGHSDSDYAAAVHTHNDIYFTETELTNYTTALAIAAGSTIAAGFYVVGSNNSVGGGITPSGTLHVKVNGTSHYVLVSATA